MKSFWDSLRLTFYDRLSSPFFGSFIGAWLICNYRALFILFSSELPLDYRFTLINRMFPDMETKLCRGLFEPLLGSVLFLLIYPIISAGVFWYWHIWERCKKFLRDKVDAAERMSVADSHKLRVQMVQLESRNEADVSGHLRTIESLRTENERLAKLTEEPIRKPLTYGMTIRLTHARTDKKLMSLNRPYVHSGTSGQNMVCATTANDQNTLWQIIGSFEQRETLIAPSPLKRGNVVRLAHVATKMNLHSHGDRNAPIQKDQQEVTAHLQDGVGDDNDNWIIEPQAGDLWLVDEPFRLVHKATAANLHSHDKSDAILTAGLQEVTCFKGRDDNDLWICRRLDNPIP